VGCLSRRVLDIRRVGVGGGGGGGGGGGENGYYLQF